MYECHYIIFSVYCFQSAVRRRCRWMPRCEPSPSTPRSRRRTTSAMLATSSLAPRRSSVTSGRAGSGTCPSAGWTWPTGSRLTRAPTPGAVLRAMRTTASRAIRWVSLLRSSTDPNKIQKFDFIFYLFIHFHMHYNVIYNFSFCINIKLVSFNEEFWNHS